MSEKNRASGCRKEARASVYHIVLVQVVHGPENLLDRLRGVFLREFALLADSIEQLSAGRKLSDDVVLVLQGMV